MSVRAPLDCDLVDEMDAALALDAVSADERRAIAEHLDSCPQPHAQVRSLLGVGALLASALEPIQPSDALRERIMRTAAATAQVHRVTEVTQVPATRPDGRAPAARRGWLDWLSPGLAGGLVAAGAAAVVVLAVWNVTLQARLSDAERISSALAEARAVYAAAGEAGQGLLLDTPDGPRFLAARLETPPSGRLYVLWLIGADGVPVDVGVVTGEEGVALVPLDDDLAGYTTFAVTLESARVDAPTSAPVLVATIGEGSGS